MGFILFVLYSVVKQNYMKNSQNQFCDWKLIVVSEEKSKLINEINKCFHSFLHSNAES